MTFDSKYYRDPSLSVKFEREYQPCYGCKHIDKLFDALFCTKGKEMKKKCKLFKVEK